MRRSRARRYSPSSYLAASAIFCGLDGLLRLVAYLPTPLRHQSGPHLSRLRCGDGVSRAAPTPHRHALRTILPACVAGAGRWRVLLPLPTAEPASLFFFCHNSPVLTVLGRTFNTFSNMPGHEQDAGAGFTPIPPPYHRLRQLRDDTTFPVWFCRLQPHCYFICSPAPFQRCFTYIAGRRLHYTATRFQRAHDPDAGRVSTPFFIHRAYLRSASPPSSD